MADSYTRSVDAALALVEQKRPGKTVEIEVSDNTTTCIIPTSEDVFHATVAGRYNPNAVILALLRSLSQEEAR